MLSLSFTSYLVPYPFWQLSTNVNNNGPNFENLAWTPFQQLFFHLTQVAHLQTLQCWDLRHFVFKAKIRIFSTWRKTFLPPCPKLRSLFCPNCCHLMSFWKKEVTFYINNINGCWFVQCNGITRCYLSKEACHKLPLHCCKCFCVHKVL
jgi:hypothetical protein